MEYQYDALLPVIVHLLFVIVANEVSFDNDASGVVVVETAENIYQRRFSAPALAEQSNQITAPKRNVYAV